MYLFADVDNIYTSIYLLDNPTRGVSAGVVKIVKRLSFRSCVNRGTLFNVRDVIRAKHSSFSRKSKF